MKKLLLLVIILPLVTSCGHLPVVEQVFSCFAPAAGDSIDVIKSEVTKILQNQQQTWSQELEDLAMRDGINTIVCIVSELIQDASSAKQASPAMMVQLIRARQYLSDHKYSVLPKK